MTQNELNGISFSLVTSQITVIKPELLQFLKTPDSRLLRKCFLISSSAGSLLEH